MEEYIQLHKKILIGVGVVILASILAVVILGSIKWLVSKEIYLPKP